MSHAITMPRYGATMQEGTINSWLVKEGQAFSKGDVLGEIAIEKLSNELLAEERLRSNALNYDNRWVLMKSSGMQS